MLLFRSEEHVKRWCEKENMAFGAILSLEQQWELAKAWYHDRLDPGWRRNTTEESEKIFSDLGLTSPFWRLSAED